MPSRSLYICYFGVREPLVQTQVIPYLRELAKDGHEISLLTFEAREFTPDEVQETAAALSSQGIEWHRLKYHKRLSVIATAYDILRGSLFVRSFVNSRRPDILHGRVHVPTLMGALGRRLARHKPKLLFDIRGFFPEEYTDAGVWPEGGLLYRMAKRVERWLLKEADGFVVLTERAREILFPESGTTGFDANGRPVEVIPCCVDLSRFEGAGEQARHKIRAEYELGDRYVMAYVGAFGGWYLTDEMADFFGMVKEKKPDAFALILTQSPPSMIEDLLRKRGYSDGDYLITKVAPKQIPEYLSAADAAVSFIKPCYSKQASSPTKNAEYLACGLPFVANSGVGDVDLLVRDNSVGAIIDDLSPAGYAAVINEIDSLGNISDLCRRVARNEFDLESVGGARYRRLYRRLLDRE